MMHSNFAAIKTYRLIFSQLIINGNDYAKMVQKFVDYR